MISDLINAPKMEFETWRKLPPSKENNKKMPGINWFRNLENILSKGNYSINVSFWGDRTISVDGYKGSVSISKLINDANYFLKEFCPPVQHCSVPERAAALRMIDKITSLHSVSSIAVKSMSIFKRAMVYLRDLFSKPFEKMYVKNNYTYTDEWKKKKGWLKDPTTKLELLNHISTREYTCTLSMLDWNKTFPTTPLPKPVEEYRPLGPKPTVDGLELAEWEFQKWFIEETPNYIAPESLILTKG